MWRLGHSFARRKVKFHSAQCGETAMNGFTKVCRDGRISDRRPQDLSHLLFHGTMVLGGTHSQTRFHLVIKIADCDACQVLALESAASSSPALIAMQSWCCGRARRSTGSPSHSIDPSFIQRQGASLHCEAPCPHTIGWRALPSARLPRHCQVLPVGVDPNPNVSCPRSLTASAPQQCRIRSRRPWGPSPTEADMQTVGDVVREDRLQAKGRTRRDATGT